MRRIVVLAGVLSLLGCGGRPAADQPKGAAPAGGGAAGGPPPIEVQAEKLNTGLASPDVALAAKVKERLAADPALRASQIEVDAQNGRVTLWGKADTAEAKAAAGKLAKATPGVTGLSNLITLKAASQPASAAKQKQ
jgi:osmotically-inducible protein OsmY